MRLVFWIIGFFVAFSFVAKPVYTQQFHGGITAGIVGSQVAGDTYSGFHKGGIFAGGYVGWEFTKHSGLQLELTYFQKGSRENPKEENNYKYLLFRVNYIELPILYMYKIQKFYIETGPSLGFLISSFEENHVQVESDKAGYNKPATITFQWNIGIRYFITDKFSGDFRYNFSIFSIRSKLRTGDVWRLWGYGQFNDALVLSVFYQFK